LGRPGPGTDTYWQKKRKMSRGAGEAAEVATLYPG